MSRIDTPQGWFDFWAGIRTNDYYARAVGIFPTFLHVFITRKLTDVFPYPGQR